MPRLLICVALALSSLSAKYSFAQQEDKYLYLEEPTSDRAMAWVKAENARTAKVLEADPRFAAYQADALKVAEDPNRLAMPMLRGGEVYNFWRDAEHVRGIYRKTTLADYLTARPTWHTVIDFDALGKQDGVRWVSKGVNCLYPGDRYCLVSLSAGGEDADTVREFDLQSEKFVDRGFQLPHSKGGASWRDKDTLLLARDWGPGTMTSSGYPFVVKQWKRGTPLSEAVEIFRGKLTDEVGSSGSTLHAPRATSSPSCAAASPSSRTNTGSRRRADSSRSPSPPSRVPRASSTGACWSPSTPTGRPQARLSSRVPCSR
jgi:prolyl oligopeptidase